MADRRRFLLGDPLDQPLLPAGRSRPRCPSSPDGRVGGKGRLRVAGRAQERGLRLILESPGVGTLFVARDGGEVVGMVSLLDTVRTAAGGPVCWLEDMVVRRVAHAVEAGEDELP